MGRTITIRIDKDLAEWLEETAARTGVSQGKIVRERLEQARAASGRKDFMRLAGKIRGPKNLSRRKGFASS